ncbi:MAG: hypothetical protein CME67_05965 [Halobacteriovoraceae bacterium]|nr:hypothetical protein [Peredibacter sp.]MBJ00761.1 hypothetical protein [Halobacteriovoraceae bacterium]
MRVNYLERHRLPLKLKPIFVGQLSIIDGLGHSAYAFKNGVFEEVLKAHEGITPDFIKQYAGEESSEIYIHEEDYEYLHDNLSQKLVKLTRSLSIGDPLKNATRHTHLLSLQMANLYEDPFNDELLNSQFQSGQNLSNLLIKNKHTHKHLYRNISKQGHHYTVTQPLLSSILLLSFLQSTGLFSEKETQTLFMTSYFKDIGMSFIPREKFDLAHLNDFDKKIFSDHADNSMKILNGRVPLGANQLELIKNHHYLNYKIQALANNEKYHPQGLITGVESALLSALDILVAMTSDRPYRQGASVFKSLELLKRVLADEHPQEFKSLVHFLKHFFGK